LPGSHICQGLADSGGCEPAATGIRPGNYHAIGAAAAPLSPSLFLRPKGCSPDAG
jgi:hypothetical protein